MLSASDIASFVEQATRDAIARVLEFIQSASADDERVVVAKDLLAESMTSPMDLPLFGKVKLFDTNKGELLKIWNQVITEQGIAIQEYTKVENIVPQKDGTFRVLTAPASGTSPRARGTRRTRTSCPSSRSVRCRRRSLLHTSD